MKKNDKIELDIVDMTKDGLGLAKVSGQVFFVKDGLIGDKVEAVITKTDKSVIYAKAISIINESKYRVESKCKVSNACGGCQLLNLDYNKQIELKKDYVFNCLKKIGKFDNVPYEGIIPCENIYYFRNKMQVPFVKKNGEIIYGFYAGRTHSIIEFDKCEVGFTGSDIILKAIKFALEEFGISIYDEKNCDGVFREVMLRKGNVSNEVSITYIINDRDYNNHVELYKKFDSFVLDKYNEISETIKQNHCLSLVTSTLNINTNNNNVIFGNKNVVLRGNGYIEDSIGDLKYHISPESFYQVNSYMTKKLYDTILDFASFKTCENVLDLYCGIGTISLYIASFVESVTVVEIVKKAIDNAKENARINDIDNASFLCKDISKWDMYEDLCEKSHCFISGNDENKSNIIDKKIVLKNKTYDTIIVDPPRKGLDNSTISFIKEIIPKKVIYVSCDPATLSRDLDILCHDDDKVYKLVKIKNVDMFPHTMHIETVCLIEQN